MDGVTTVLVAAVALCGAGLAVGVTRPLWRRYKARSEAEARAAFRRQREMLEARFFDLAAGSGKPRGLRWTEIDFRDEVSFARDRSTGMLAAFVGVNIRFEAIPGGEMEDVAAVSNVRDAAALFHFQRGQWGTGGKVLFNVSPQEAIARYHAQYEALPEAVLPRV